MHEFNKLDKKGQIAALCDHHRCNDKVRQIHHDQYVHRHWNPHPPARFIQWWGEIGCEVVEKNTGRAWTDIDAVRAFNCEVVRELYREHKQLGIAAA